MLFGFTNTPSTFTILMNYLLHAFIGKFIVVYFDDIMTNSKEFDEHINHLRQILDMLRKESLYANLNRCHFCKDRIIFLGYMLMQKVFKRWMSLRVRLFKNDLHHNQQ